MLRQSYDAYYTEESYGTRGLKSLQITECPDIVMEKVRVLVPGDRTTVHLSTTRILIAFLQPSHPSARKSLAEHSILNSSRNRLFEYLIGGYGVYSPTLPALSRGCYGPGSIHNAVVIAEPAIRLTQAETESGFGKPEYRELELRNTFCRHNLRAPAGGRAGLRRDRKSDIDMYISTQSTNSRRQTLCCDLV